MENGKTVDTTAECVVKKSAVRKFSSFIYRGAKKIVVGTFALAVVIGILWIGHGLKNWYDDRNNAVLNDAKQQISSLSDMLKQEGSKNWLVEAMKLTANPELKGIDFHALTVPVLGPKDLSEEEVVSLSAAAVWAKDNGYDGILFGLMQVGLDGQVYWTDLKKDNKTNANFMITALENKGLKKVFAFISNPDQRHLPSPVKFQTMGHLNLQKKEHYALGVWGTGKPKYEIQAENFEGEVGHDGKFSFKVSGRDSATHFQEWQKSVQQPPTVVAPKPAPAPVEPKQDGVIERSKDVGRWVKNLFTSIPTSNQYNA